jgi:serine/threonine protein kinase
MKSQRPGPPMPERVGPYELLTPIASGGMATVYLARDASKRQVALKLTHAHLRESASFEDEVVEEAALAARIHHPNVVPVLEVGRDPQGVFLVMELVDGDTLGGLNRLAKRAGLGLVPTRIALRILIDALTGLHAAHELRGDDGALLHVVHRDFSPQNILIGRDGVTRLTDFGVAKAASRSGHTAVGYVKGKIRYMSPEQARSEKLDRRSDLFAAGIVAWEICVGRRFHDEQSNDTAILIDLVTKPAVRASSVRADVPAALDAALAKVLSPDPADRFASAQEFASALEASTTVASVAEVAAFVSQLTEASHLERKATIASVLAARGEPPEPEPALSAPVRSESPAAATKVADPAPAAAMAARADDERPDLTGESTLLMTRPAAPPAAGTPESAATHAAEAAEPRDTTGETATGDAATGDAATDDTGAHRRASDPPETTTASSAAIGDFAVPARQASARPTWVAWALIPAAAAGVWWATRKPPAPAAVASAMVTSPESALSTELPTPAPPTAQVSARAPSRARVRISANDRMAELVVAGRKLAPPAAAHVVDVELSPEESAAGVAISAKHPDGRTTKGTIAPLATSAQLQFPAVVASPPDLAPNPYLKRK